MGLSGCAQTIDPLSVFEEVRITANLHSSVSIIVSELHMQQAGKLFCTEPRQIRAFLGINFIMGYHELPAIKDYWSASPTLGVPFIANVMTRDCFQQILAALHFSKAAFIFKNNYILLYLKIIVAYLILYFYHCQILTVKPFIQARAVGPLLNGLTVKICQ